MRIFPFDGTFHQRYLLLEQSQHLLQLFHFRSRKQFVADSLHVFLSLRLHLSPLLFLALLTVLGHDSLELEQQGFDGEGRAGAEPAAVLGREGESEAGEDLIWVGAEVQLRVFQLESLDLMALVGG